MPKAKVTNPAAPSISGPDTPTLGGEAIEQPKMADDLAGSPVAAHPIISVEKFPILLTFEKWLDERNAWFVHHGLTVELRKDGLTVDRPSLNAVVYSNKSNGGGAISVWHDGRVFAFVLKETAGDNPTPDKVDFYADLPENSSSSDFDTALSDWQKLMET